MTICIAASCDGNKRVIMISDRMLTVGRPYMQFDHGVPKIECVSNLCTVASAGSALVYKDFIRDVKTRVADRRVLPVPELIDVFKECYASHRMKKVEELILKPRGLTLKSYVEEGSRMLPREVYMLVDGELTEFDFGLELLIAGADSEGTHIYRVFNPGTATCYDVVGYCAIGSGAEHAVSVFTADNYLSLLPFKRALYIAYEAKRTAEIAPGVGQATDIVCISEDGAKPLDDDTLRALSAIFDKKKKSQAEALSALEEDIEKLPVK